MHKQKIENMDYKFGPFHEEPYNKHIINQQLHSNHLDIPMIILGIILILLVGIIIIYITKWYIKKGKKKYINKYQEIEGAISDLRDQMNKQNELLISIMDILNEKPHKKHKSNC